MGQTKKLVISDCPTMATYVADLQNDKSVALVAYNSSQEALKNLAINNVDCVVISRKAESYEIK